MFRIALFEPQIPPNTGNIIRLCANTGCALDLIGTLGFSLEDKLLRRAGLDYRQYSTVKHWPEWSDYEDQRTGRLIALSTRYTRTYSDFNYQSGDVLLFGSELNGLPETIHQQMIPDHCLTIPMQPVSRSLNLSNSVAIVVYEAWRQQGFALPAQSGIS